MATKAAESANKKARRAEISTSVATPQSSYLHAVALEVQTLLESLRLLDELLSRTTLSDSQGTLLKVKRSILRRLDELHSAVAPTLATRSLSGGAWVAKFPDSKSTSDLDGAFATGVNDFIASMKAGGASVSIGTTKRPIERAYLMHYAYKIANNSIKPEDVPAMTGVDIEWVHDSLAASQRAAKDMVDGYGIVAQPALNSRHTEGKAIDMTILWNGTLKLKNKAGSEVSITTTPRNGENADLVKVGKTFDVIKATFSGDPPHWSSDGH